MPNSISNTHYIVEYNGRDYVILFGVRVIAAFASSEEAFKAKRSLEDRPVLSDYDKTPPAIRAAKAIFANKKAL